MTDSGASYLNVVILRTTNNGASQIGFYIRLWYKKKSYTESYLFQIQACYFENTTDVVFLR